MLIHRFTSQNKLETILENSNRIVSMNLLFSSMDDIEVIQSIDGVCIAVRKAFEKHSKSIRKAMCDSHATYVMSKLNIIHRQKQKFIDTANVIWFVLSLVCFRIEQTDFLTAIATPKKNRKKFSIIGKYIALS